MTQNTSNNSSQNIEETDIFEWFKADEQLIKEVEQFEQTNQKDIYDTLGRIWDMCKIWNVVVFSILVLLIGYIYSK